jgi:hypothetical protein
MIFPKSKVEPNKILNPMLQTDSHATRGVGCSAPRRPVSYSSHLKRRYCQPQNIMSLFPDEDVLTKEIQSWRGFADQLPVKDRQIFMKMLNDCYKYSTAINAKGQPLQSEPVIMVLLLSQHKLIEWLENQWKKVRACSEAEADK